MLEQVRIILVNPSHPGNIGATARAMKNMGLSELCLVAPDRFPDGEATARASGADDILESAEVVTNIEQAVLGCGLVLGTSARERRLEKPLLSPSEAATEVKSLGNQKTALLFGRESIGLTNEELSLCHAHIVIPTVEEFSSLNLAQAVQIICYALRVAELGCDKAPTLFTEERELASADQVFGFYDHLQQTLIEIKFLNPSQPKMLMQRLQRLFNRAQLDSTEINILRGILSRVEGYAGKSKGES